MVCKPLLLAVALQQFVNAFPLNDPEPQSPAQCRNKVVCSGNLGGPTPRCLGKILICEVADSTQASGWCKQCEENKGWYTHRLWNYREYEDYAIYGHLPKPNPDLDNPEP